MKTMANKTILAALEKAFTIAEASDDFAVHLDFKEKLLASSEPEVIDYHFELLKRTKNDELIETLATFFKWRGISGEEYLIARIAAESNPFLISIALQILGVMRSKSAAIFARQFISHADERVRERACIVLGWVGTRKDLAILRELGLTDPSVNVRKWAATQQMHIWLRFPAAKHTVAANLNDAIQQESHDEVLEMIIYTAQEVLGRRFGLKDDKHSRRKIGDLAEAKRKAGVALTNLVNKK
jgi:HEAT repeat protein